MPGQLVESLILFLFLPVVCPFAFMLWASATGRI